MDVTDVYQGRCFTEVKIERVKFQWKINDFSQRTEMLKSSVFPSTPGNIGKWLIFLRPNHYKVEKDVTDAQLIPVPYISIEVRSVANMDILAKMKMSLVNDKGSVEKSRVTKWKKYNLSNKTVFMYYISTIKDCLPNDELSILCEIEIKRSMKKRCQEFVPTKFDIKRPLCRLAEDMGNLLSSESLTDLTITVGERQFRAHKAILAARSSVFAAMFRNQMEENKFGAVKITDIDPDVFQEMLEFIYTGKEISQTNRTTELLAAADKYQLDRLKLLCEEALCKVLSVDNVLEIIALADLYNASYLRQYALDYVMKNSSHIIRTSGWDLFKRSHQSIVVEIFEKIGSELTFY